MKTQHSARELAAKQEKHCEKHKVGLTTKLTNTVHTKNIGHIAGVIMKISSEKWCQKNVGKELGIKEGKLEINKELLHQQG